ncbi:MAG: hypothetical protein LBJ63_07805 [Prevotellaceae bacterium]|jgi:hypothetical protein|nr:hypothetical protein [Prevotellaceae bacterium]
MNTRSNEMVSLQIGKMGVVENLASSDFFLDSGQSFLIKNDSDDAVTLEVQLAAMKSGEFVSTIFDTGWNPELVKKIKTNSTDVRLKWGY